MYHFSDKIILGVFCIKIYFLSYSDTLFNEKLPEFKKLFPNTDFEKIKNSKFKISLLAKFYVKKIAAKFLNATINTLDFEKTSNGKPFLKNYPDFHFNISHSNNLIAIAIDNSQIGIDIEKIREVNLKLANRHFCENEINFINSNNERFFEIWTKKEAYLKQTGKGIIGNLNKFDVTTPPISESLTTFTYENFIVSFSTSTNKNQYSIINLNCEEI